MTVIVTVMMLVMVTMVIMQTSMVIYRYRDS